MNSCDDLAQLMLAAISYGDEMMIGLIFGAMGFAIVLFFMALIEYLMSPPPKE